MHSRLGRAELISAGVVERGRRLQSVHLIL